MLFPHLLSEKLSSSPVQSPFPHKYQCFPNTTYSQGTVLTLLMETKSLSTAHRQQQPPSGSEKRNQGQNGGCNKAKEQGTEEKKGQEGKK